MGGFRCRAYHGVFSGLLRGLTCSLSAWPPPTNLKYREYSGAGLQILWIPRDANEVVCTFTLSPLFDQTPAPVSEPLSMGPARAGAD